MSVYSVTERIFDDKQRYILLNNNKRDESLTIRLLAGKDYREQTECTSATCENNRKL